LSLERKKYSGCDATSTTFDLQFAGDAFPTHEESALLLFWSDAQAR
jgi:hypothetical protein